MPSWEPHFAEKWFLDKLEKAGVKLKGGQHLKEVKKKGNKITSLVMQEGGSYKADLFIDATYEGDLMAEAGVSYTVGRESKDKYNESLAGVRYPDDPIPVSPYDENGDLLPGVMQAERPEAGSEDQRLMVYNIRLNVTNNPDNRVPITRPDNYDPAQYELLARCLENGVIKKLKKIIALYDMGGDHKRELNNKQNSIVSLGMPGRHYNWPEAGYEERREIYKAHKQYTQGLL